MEPLYLRRPWVTCQLLPGMMAFELPSTRKAEASLGYIVTYYFKTKSTYYETKLPVTTSWLS